MENDLLNLGKASCEGIEIEYIELYYYCGIIPVVIWALISLCGFWKIVKITIRKKQ